MKQESTLVGCVPTAFIVPRVCKHSQPPPQPSLRCRPSRRQTPFGYRPLGDRPQWILVMWEANPYPRKQIDRYNITVPQLGLRVVTGMHSSSMHTIQFQAGQGNSGPMSLPDWGRVSGGRLWVV